MVDSALMIFRWGIGLVLIFFTWFIIAECLKKDDTQIAGAINQAEQEVTDNPFSTKPIGTLTDGITSSMKELGGKEEDLAFWERFNNAVHRALDEGGEFARRFWDEKSEMIRTVSQKIAEGFRDSIFPIIKPFMDLFYGVFFQPAVDMFWGTNKSNKPKAAPIEVSKPKTPAQPVSQPDTQEEERRVIERDPSGLFN